MNDNSGNHPFALFARNYDLPSGKLLLDLFSVDQVGQEQIIGTVPVRRSTRNTSVGLGGADRDVISRLTDVAKLRLPVYAACGRITRRNVRVQFRSGPLFGIDAILNPAETLCTRVAIRLFTDEEPSARSKPDGCRSLVA